MLTTHEVRALLDKLCVDHGFCLPPDARAKIESDPPTTPEEFTDAVFAAEGFEPATADRSLYRGIKRMIAEVFRASEIAREREEFGDQ